MIDVQQAIATLKEHYPDLETVSERVFKGTDRHAGSPYAVRYFDLRDDMPSSLESFQKYQEELLGEAYYAPDAKADLRWNHYLYFVASAEQFRNETFSKAKRVVEADREYARKLVVEESLLETVIARAVFAPTDRSTFPPDPLSVWVSALDRHSLGFVVDDSLQVPDVVQHIIAGRRQGRQRPPTAPPITPEEAAAATELLAKVEIQGFRPFPEKRSFELGLVNLISGVNGVGKTSTLEAIEFLFCGKTKRSEKPVLPNTTVSGAWATSGLTLRTGHGTPASQFRARQLAWYGRTELRKQTLDDSFGKFNFLDTDAAVRLTVESSLERLTEDVFQLLLGAESSKALDRLDRVAKQLNDAQRAIEKDIGVTDMRRGDALRRVEEIRGAPRESDAYLRDVESKLLGLGWRQPLVEKSEVPALSDALVAVMTDARLLPATLGAGVSADEQRATAEVLRGVTRTLSDMVQQERRSEAEAKRVRGQLKKNAERLAAIDALQPLVRARVATISKERDALRGRYSDESSRLATVESAIGSIPEGVGDEALSIADAVRHWAGVLEGAASEKESALRRLAALENAQSALTNARQQIRSGALAAMEHSHDATHCPLCGTAFEAGRLRTLVDALVGGDGGVILDTGQVRRDVEAAENRRHQAHRTVEALRAVQTFTKASGQERVAECLALIGAERKRLLALQAELGVRDEEMKAQAQLGWTMERVRALAASAGVSEQVTEDQLSVVADDVTAESRDLTRRLSDLEREDRERAAKSSELSATHGFAPNMSLVAMQAEAGRRVGTAEQVVAAAGRIEERLELRTWASVEELRASLDQAHELVAKLRTAVQRESENDQAVLRETTLAEDAAKEIEAYEVRLKRIATAKQVIEELAKGQSGRVLAGQVLRENAASIGATFEKVHSPNEFDVRVDATSDDALHIVRRATGRKVELDEMSSGQRAAYALSLFLAMNERLRTGPRVLIFDDPVSHVDDINTLSFLDHLRDIALTRMRQIFFATADTKLAGLFVRKFRFLGDEFKHVQLERQA